MEKLTLHIEYLLLRHDCVVVPGLGAFLNVRHSAYLDDSSKVWMPMTEEVRFNAAIRHDDAMLATSYVRREHMDYPQAKERVRQGVRELMEAMQQCGEVTVGNLGTLILSEDTISFQPAYSPEMMARRMGLIPVADSPSIPARVAEADNSPEAPEETGRRFNTVKNYYIQVNKRFARYAAAVSLLLAVALSILLPFGKDLREDQASIIPVKAITEVIAGQNEIKETNETPRVATEMSPESPASVEPEEWQLIVGTFTTESEAKNFIEHNANSGYSLIILPSRRLHRVSALGAKKKEMLLSTLNSPEFQAKYDQAWIYHLPKKIKN